MKVEWLILADAAQIVGGKLYLMGGGWDNLIVNTRFPFDQRLAVAASFQIDWNETNEPHNVAVEITTADGQTLAAFGGKVEAGRPPGIPIGQAQRAQLAAEVTLPIAGPGTYEITVRVPGQDPTQIHFNVVAGPFLGLQRPSAEGAA